jgi:hypothetical protein
MILKAFHQSPGITQLKRAVLTGLEPAISTVTRWQGLHLPYKTMALVQGLEPRSAG